MAFKGPYILVSPKIGPFILLNAGVSVFPSAKERRFFSHKLKLHLWVHAT